MAAHRMCTPQGPGRSAANESLSTPISTPTPNTSLPTPNAIAHSRAPSMKHGPHSCTNIPYLPSGGDTGIFAERLKKNHNRTAQQPSQHTQRKHTARQQAPPDPTPESLTAPPCTNVTGEHDERQDLGRDQDGADELDPDEHRQLLPRGLPPRQGPERNPVRLDRRDGRTGAARSLPLHLLGHEDAQVPRPDPADHLRVLPPAHRQDDRIRDDRRSHVHTLTIERYNAESQKKATEDYGNKKMFIDTKGFNITAAQATDTFRIHMAELGISLKGEVWEVTDATTRTRTGSWGAGFEYMSLFAIDLIIRKNVMIRIDGNPAKLTFHKAFADSQKFCNSCNKYTAHPPPIAYGIPPQHHPHHHESEKCDCHLNKGKRPAETKASKVTAFQMRRAKAKKTTLA